MKNYMNFYYRIAVLFGILFIMDTLNISMYEIIAIGVIGTIGAIGTLFSKD